MNLNEYITAEEELERLYTLLENIENDSEADGILRRVDLLERRISEYLEEDKYILKYTEEEEY